MSPNRDRGGWTLKALQAGPAGIDQRASSLMRIHLSEATARRVPRDTRIVRSDITTDVHKNGVNCGATGEAVTRVSSGAQ
ncbi:hypothetical protein EVAR_84550_1 [Eumeta japonica]|uniref:Uncharacterized protein n=1 Tax=Eumeta variegata TaxID=151549 RepID=A0A4C1UIK6_EUMVA|nr:hypothetical protein EVAR_84550_1 [Eumeta japonica]